MRLIRQAEKEKGFQYTLLQGDPDISVSALVYDTRKITEGCLFVCMKGARFDPHTLIGEIAEKGAAAIVIEEECPLPEGVTVIRVENARRALAFLSAAWFGNPAEQMKIIGITGTKGKTTTAHMLKTILEKAGKKVGMIGTVGMTCGNISIPTLNTTPESYELHEAFRRMADMGCEYVVMEVSSQGLKLHRTDGIRFEIALFTNITPDHIGQDEHKDFDEYLSCKKLLFRQCRLCLVNIDDPLGREVLDYADCAQKFSFGEKSGADFMMSELEPVREPGFVGIRFGLSVRRTSFTCSVGLPGRFNGMNALAAISAAMLLQLPLTGIGDSLKEIHVNGRMEAVYKGDFTAVVDYAHNAVSMDALLDALREYGPARLIVVFGCGGNRAKERRYTMGEIAGKKADLSIITADNSRYEKTEDIIADIRGSIEKTGGAFVEIPDRREAIYYAMKTGRPGDMIAVIGKGHEDYQEINGVRHHFLDREVILDAVKELGL